MLTVLMLLLSAAGDMALAVADDPSRYPQQRRPAMEKPNLVMLFVDGVHVPLSRLSRAHTTPSWLLAESLKVRGAIEQISAMAMLASPAIPPRTLPASTDSRITGRFYRLGTQAVSLQLCVSSCAGPARCATTPCHAPHQLAQCQTTFDPCRTCKDRPDEGAPWAVYLIRCCGRNQAQFAPARGLRC